jgi:hypothetical protein
MRSLLLSLAFIWFYPLSERRVAEIRSKNAGIPAAD